MASLPVSLVINTLQAERYLDLTIRSALPLVSELIVVDMHSTDRTRAIAAEHGARIFDFEQVGYVEPARRYAMEQATQPWVLLLDADEVIPQQLATRIRAVVETDEADLVWMPWLNYMFGSPIRACRFEPEREMHLRLFKRGMVAFGDAVHAPITPDPNARSLRLDPERDGVMWHFNYSDIGSFVQRMDRYTTLEAREGSPSSPARILRKCVREFVNRYWRTKGYRLGWRGLSVSLLMSFYTALKEIKIHQRAAGLDDATIVGQYRALAEAELTRSSAGD